jgi:hypothetical protein
MIKKAMDALVRQDYKAFSDCFSEDCKYFDYCPAQHGKDNYVVYGRDGVEMFFRNRFAFDLLIVAQPVIEDENTASFFGAYDAPFVFARFEIEATDEAGLIRRAVVHPA